MLDDKEKENLFKKEMEKMNNSKQTEQEETATNFQGTTRVVGGVSFDKIIYNKSKLADAGCYYPDGYSFKIAKLTGEAMAHFSEIDENDPVDTADKISYVIKNAVELIDHRGMRLSHRLIFSHDKFKLFLAVRDYCFLKQPEQDLKWTAKCPNGHDNQISLSPDILTYKLPNKKWKGLYNNQENIQNFTLDLSTVDPDIKETIIYAPPRLGHEENTIKYTYWLKRNNIEISKINLKLFSTFVTANEIPPQDEDKVFKEFEIVAKRIKNNNKIRTHYMKFIERCEITLNNTIKKGCEYCESEVSTQIRFPDGLGAIFDVKDKLTEFFED